jgi:hypothetical protein
MDLPETCRLITKHGTYCGKPRLAEFSVCKAHSQYVACPWPLPGDQPCGVAIEQGLDRIDPKELPRHPHHKHLEVRSVILPPEYRECRVCHTPISSITGFCADHDAYAAQLRREEVIRQWEANPTIFKADKAELIRVLKNTQDAETLVNRLHLSDLVNAQPVDNVYEELYVLAGQIVKWKDILAQRVSQLNYLGYGSEHAGEQVLSDVQLFTSALAEARNILVSIAKLDVEEKRVRVAEAQAMMVAEALGRVLDSLGLDDRSILRARSSIASQLRVINSTEPRALTV